MSMTPVKRVKSRELQANVSELLADVAGGQAVIVERYNQPIAALVPIKDFHLLQAGKQRRGMKRIALSNISGGETKTTLTLNLAAWYARQGLRVGVIDLDPQASLTKFLGLHLDPDSPAWTAEATVLGVLMGRGGMPEPIRIFDFDLWPANELLGDATARLMQGTGFTRLREATQDLSYDVLLLDTMPGMGPLLIASLAAADDILVPVNSVKGLQNLEPLAQMITAARSWSPDLSVCMFIPSGLQANLNYHKLVVQALGTYSDLAPVGPRVREANRLIGLQSLQHRPAVLIEPRNGFSEDIGELAVQVASLVGLPLGHAVAP
ncbi:type II toxin-antitoxin system prevent-host-death family antitoxin [Deinococcus sp. Leaf326]|uniref:type II toxin-antitoxin system prevent-host-death family antitoxin n=1 Tax=Deinococcus sp. Leaf326 TaxID=1736338 RepID=UPI0009E704E0|nr:type II toxin-antitoxin system prevent-host-death family antitoxin [Deinococcus sp. Leaf326]